MSESIVKLSDCSLRSYRQKNNRDSFIAESRLVHQDRYKYDFVEWVNGVTKVEIVCDKHGSFLQFPFRHLNGSCCKQCGIEARSGVNAVPHKKMLATMPDPGPNTKISTYSKVIVKCDKHGEYKSSTFALKNGTGHCPQCANEHRNEWDLYKSQVRIITEKQWRERQTMFNPYSLPRGKFDYHIDHQFSIKEGFNNLIPPYIVGHWTNLWMVPWRENLQKNKQSIISIDLLFRNYFWAVKHFNEIK